MPLHYAVRGVVSAGPWSTIAATTPVAFSHACAPTPSAHRMPLSLRCYRPCQRFLHPQLLFLRLNQELLPIIFRMPAVQHFSVIGRSPVFTPVSISLLFFLLFFSS